MRKGGRETRKRTRKKLWNSQTGQLWLGLLFLGIVVAALIPFWINGQRQEARGQETIRVLMPSGDVCTMALEEYVIGVVAAEMPANFEMEALKAQGVASRTFAARRIAAALAGGTEYDVDTTTATQVWRSDEQLRERWGADYEGNRAKIAGAVRQTCGQVLMFEHTLATTAFFSNTGRLPTESSDDVWGGSLSYLSSVSSPESEGPEGGGYVRQKSMKVKEFLRALNIQSGTGLGASDIKVLERTTAGRIARISVAGHEIKGTDFRKALELASTDVEWEIREGKIYLTTFGYGHGVGLSQYGAQNMALQGRGYEAILAHYYQGTELNQIDKVAHEEADM
ncbi:MAG: stage II sporulation protein D [Peptococcaceae bacterium]|nr:stage II sporulation protein D [Peptococcaceae bacterium]